MTKSYNYGTALFFGFGVLTDILALTLVRDFCVGFLEEVGLCPSRVSSAV